MAREHFGTDGVRGVAGVKLTAELALALGRAAAQETGVEHPRVLVIRDTRESGEMLEAALAAGVTSAGGDVFASVESLAHVPSNPFFAANISDIAQLEAYMDALRKAGDSCGARIRVEAHERAGRPGRAAVRQARRRHRLRDDGHQRGQGRRDRRRLCQRRAARHHAWRRADAAKAFAATTRAACWAASAPGRTSRSASRSSPPVRSARRARRSTARASRRWSRPSAATTRASASAPRPSPRRCWRWC